MTTTLGRWAIPAAVIVLVIIVVIKGLLLIGSPGEQRARRFDQQRVTDLRGIARATDVYWKKYGQLPQSLEVLAKNYPGVRINDPQSRHRYAYQAMGLDDFELCAVFARKSPKPQRPVLSERAFFHGAGRQCFKLNPPKPVPGKSSRQNVLPPPPRAAAN